MATEINYSEKVLNIATDLMSNAETGSLGYFMQVLAKYTSNPITDPTNLTEGATYTFLDVGTGADFRNLGGPTSSTAAIGDQFVATATGAPTDWGTPAAILDTTSITSVAEVYNGNYIKISLTSDFKETGEFISINYIIPIDILAEDLDGIFGTESGDAEISVVSQDEILLREVSD